MSNLDQPAGPTSVFRGVRLLCGAVALHLHLPPVVDVPARGRPPLHLFQPPHGAATAVAAGTHRDLSDSGFIQTERQHSKLHPTK